MRKYQRPGPADTLGQGQLQLAPEYGAGGAGGDNDDRPTGQPWIAYERAFDHRQPKGVKVRCTNKSSTSWGDQRRWDALVAVVDSARVCKRC